MQKTTHSLVSGFFYVIIINVEKRRKHEKIIKHETRGGASPLGFTLAEVLITLAIIGVVAALTIPTLISKYQEKQVVSSLTKIYSTLSQAYQMMQAEYGQISTWGLKNTNNGDVDEEGVPIYDHSAKIVIAERFKHYLKVARTC